MVLMAGSESRGISEEGSWTEEILKLRRWLAEDRLEPGTSWSSSDRRPQRPHPEMDDEMGLMQRGSGGRRPPWERSRSRDRSRQNKHEEMRRRRKRAERHDTRTNAHRPWRTTSTMSTDPTRCRPPAVSHPAEARVGDNVENLGVHAWHVLLHMIDVHTAPRQLQYGLARHQADNVRASLQDMNAAERLHLMSSFLRMIALLTSDVADIVGEVLQGGGTHPEGDDSALMQRFLKKTNEGDKGDDLDETEKMDATEGSETKSGGLRGDPFEMEVRALVSALEIAAADTSMKRARAMVERLRMRMGLFSATRRHDGGPLEALESALITFLPESWEAELEDNVYHYEGLAFSDRDFVDYWWKVVTRRLRGVIESGSSNSGAASSTQAPLVAMSPRQTYEGTNVTEEELQLIAELERAERQDAEVPAANEYAQMIESQEAETDSQSRHWMRRKGPKKRDRFPTTPTPHGSRECPVPRLGTMGGQRRDAQRQGQAAEHRGEGHDRRLCLRPAYMTNYVMESPSRGRDLLDDADARG